MAAPLDPPPSTLSLYADRLLPPPPFPKYSRRSTAIPSKELRGGHRPPPTSVGTVAEASSSTNSIPTGPGSSSIQRGSCSVRALGWSIDGRRLASSSSDRTIRIWTPERSVDHRATSELRGHTDAVEQLAWDPTNPESLATASGDRTVKFWDIRTASASSTISTFGNNINIAYHPAGNLIAVGDRDDNVSLIDVRASKVLGLIRSQGSPPEINSIDTQWIKSEREEINEFSWSPDGSLFVLGTGGGDVRLLDARVINVQEDVIEHSDQGKSVSNHAIRWPVVHTIVGHTASVFCLKFDPIGRYLATASADSTTALWSLQEWFNVSMSGHLSSPPRSISFSFDGEFLAAGGEDNFISITATIPMDPSMDSPLHKIPVTSAVNCLTWHPSRAYLAYAGDDKEGTIRIWNMP
jgi:THO complex subunit 3